MRRLAATGSLATSMPQIRSIVDLLLNRVRKQLAEQRLTLKVTDEAKQFLAEKGWDPQFGARPLRRVIMNMIEDPMADGMLQGKFHSGEVIVIDIVNGELTMNAEQPTTEALPAGTGAK